MKCRKPPNNISGKKFKVNGQMTRKCCNKFNKNTIRIILVQESQKKNKEGLVKEKIAEEFPKLENLYNHIMDSRS